MAVFEEFQQIAALRWSKDGQAPVIEDKHIQFGDGPEHAGVTSVTSGQGEGLKEARDAVIDNAAPVTARFVTERAGDPAFAQTCRAGDQKVLMAIDPCAIHEMGQHCSVDAARGA